MRNNSIYASKEKDKILYFLDYGKYFGGAVNTLLRQALLTKRAGYKVIIFFSDYWGKELQEEYRVIFQKEGIEYEWATYQIASHPEDVDIICIDAHYEQLKQKIMVHNPDILHSVQINPCVELVSRELGIPHIMNIYPLLPEFFSVDYINIFPHYHICDSWYWAERWHSYLKTDYTCIRTVVDCKEHFVKGKMLRKPIRYICTGVLDVGKNQLNVIRAFHQALQEGVSGILSLYGYDEGIYAEECRQYVIQYNLSEWIHIEGFCTDMESVYQKSDVLICGSRRDSYPNVISEAMAYGLVVISTPVAGVPEIIKDGENGYLTENDSVEAICKKIVEFNSDIGQKRLEIIKENTYKTFEQNHSPEVVTKSLLAYYEHVVQDNKKSSEIHITDIMISDIRKRFAPMIHLFYQKFEEFADPRKISLKLWYLYHIKPAIEEAAQRGAVFYIWGAGKYGLAVKEMLEVFLPEISVSGFIDSNRSGTFFEYIINEPKELLKKKNTVLFVAVGNEQQEIFRQLEDNNKIFNKDYFILSVRIW